MIRETLAQTKGRKDGSRPAGGKEEKALAQRLVRTIVALGV